VYTQVAFVLTSVYIIGKSPLCTPTLTHGTSLVYIKGKIKC